MRILCVISCVLFTLGSVGCELKPKIEHKGPVSKPLSFKINHVNKIELAHLDVLRRYLASSHKWILRKPVADEWVAARRPLWKSKLYSTKNDFFYLSDSSNVQGFVELALHTNAVFLEDMSKIDAVHGSVKDIQLKLFATEHADIFESTLLLVAPVLTVKIVERSEDTSRSFTQRALVDISKELKRVVDSMPLVDQRGFLHESVLFQFPSGGSAVPLSADEQSLWTDFWRVADFPTKKNAAGIWLFCENDDRKLFPSMASDCNTHNYQVHGLVNNREPGHVFLRVLNLATNKRLKPGHLRMSASEYVGWTSERESLMPYVGHIQILPTFGSGDHRLAIELWLQPEGTGTLRRIASATVDVKIPEPKPADSSDEL